MIFSFSTNDILIQGKVASNPATLFEGGTHLNELKLAFFCPEEERLGKIVDLFSEWANESRFGITHTDYEPQKKRFFIRLQGENKELLIFALQQLRIQPIQVFQEILHHPSSSQG